jgi:FkbM family methyltransferase
MGRLLDTVRFVTRHHDLFVHVGANVATCSVLARKKCAASSFAIEPDPGTSRSLFRNIGLNAIDDLVEAIEAAAAATEGRARFTVGLDSCNRVATADDGDVREVRVVPLDKIIGTRQPAIIKMDVEGFEAAVLAGASETLERRSLLAVLTETESGGVAETLYAAGFRPAYYKPFTRKLDIGPAISRDGAANALFVRDVEALRVRLAAAPKRLILEQAL